MYVYAVTPPAAPVPRLRGLRGERLVVVRTRHAAAIGGLLPRAPAPTPRNLHAQHRLVQDIAERVPAVLPVRFGTIMDEGDVQTLLRLRDEVFRHALRRVRGRVQMTVRFPSVAPRPVRPAATGGATTGAGWLRARARVASRAAKRPEAVELRAAVRRWVRAEVVAEQGDVLTVYHLIPRAAAAAYRRAADARSARAGRAALVGGPYPPFAFTPDLAGDVAAGTRMTPQT